MEVDMPTQSGKTKLSKDYLNEILKKHYDQGCEPTCGSFEETDKYVIINTNQSDNNHVRYIFIEKTDTGLSEQHDCLDIHYYPRNDRTKEIREAFLQVSLSSKPGGQSKADFYYPTGNSEIKVEDIHKVREFLQQSSKHLENDANKKLSLKEFSDKVKQTIVEEDSGGYIEMDFKALLLGHELRDKLNTMKQKFQKAVKDLKEDKDDKNKLLKSAKYLDDFIGKTLLAKEGHKTLPNKTRGGR